MIVFLRLFWQQVIGIGFDQHEPGNLAHVQVCEGAYVVAAEGMTDQNIWSFYSSVLQRTVQLLGDAHAGTRHGAGIAESRAGSVIAEGARKFGDLWLHLRPRWCPVFPSGIEDDRGRAAPHAVEI